MRTKFLKEPIEKDVVQKNLHWKFLYAKRRGEFIDVERSKGRVSTHGVTIHSAYGEQTWKIGTWYEIPGHIRLCHNGFHSSPHIHGAYRYVSGTIIALVEYAGDTMQTRSDNPWGHRVPVKRVSQRMRIVRAWLVTKEFKRNVLWNDWTRDSEVRARVVELLPEIRRPKKKGR